MRRLFRSRWVDASAPEGENYLASVSDMMAGLLFVFMIMVVYFALQYQQAKEREARMEVEVSLGREERTRILNQLKTSLAYVGVRVNIDEANGILRLPEEILFEQGQSHLKARGRLAVQTTAHELKKALKKARHMDAVLVEGHSDDVPIDGVLREGELQYHDNWDLSFNRAKETYMLLQQTEKSLLAFKNSHQQPLLSMSAYADKRPVASNATAEGRKRNRRIDIRLIIETPEV